MKIILLKILWDWDLDLYMHTSSDGPMLHAVLPFCARRENAMIEILKERSCIEAQISLVNAIARSLNEYEVWRATLLKKDNRIITVQIALLTCCLKEFTTFGCILLIIGTIIFPRLTIKKPSGGTPSLYWITNKCPMCFKLSLFFPWNFFIFYFFILIAGFQFLLQH